MKFSVKHLVSVSAIAAVAVVGLSGCRSNTAAKQKSDTLTVVFLPSDSTKEQEPVRNALSKLIHKATGKQVKLQTTTDYNVAIEAMASGKAQIGLMGPDSYVEARRQNGKVAPLVTYSGASGTLRDAHYFSYLMVPKNQVAAYQQDGKYSLTKLKGKSISFVAATSTSGFAVPAGAIAKENNVKVTALQKGGDFFNKVLYGQSHPGSAVNLFNGDADVAAFDDIDLVKYGSFTNDKTKAGADFKVSADAPAPLDRARGKESVALAAYPVQNEPLAVNSSAVSKADQDKIVKALTSKSTTDNQLFFSKPGAKMAGLFTQTGKVHFIHVTDKWYAPTHKVLGH